MTSITRWNPLRDVNTFQNEMNELFEPLLKLNRMRVPGEAAGSEHWMPPVDIEETQDRLFLRAELAGFKPEDVEIQFQDGVLTVRGERRFENERNDRNFHRIERSYGTFSRSFALPKTVDADNARARYENGVLELEMPKREEAKPKRIAISTVGQGPAVEASANRSK